MTRQAAWDKFLVAKVSLDNKPSCFFRIHPLNRFVGNIHNRYPSPALYHTSSIGEIPPPFRQLSNNLSTW